MPTTVPLGLPRWKVTVPVGVPVPEDLVTVAVSVTPCPWPEGSGEEVRAVEVPAVEELTTWGTTPEIERVKLVPRCRRRTAVDVVWLPTDVA